MSQLEIRHTGGTITDVKERPLISAVVVTSNHESQIRGCLMSLLEQSVAERMEVIVVDQGSQQSEWAVIADLQRSHENLISVRTAGKHPAGLDLAMKIASGSYLTVLEPTDRMRQDAYQQLVAALEDNPEAMLAYGDTCFTSHPHQTFASHTSCGKMIWPDYAPHQPGQLSQMAPHPLWRSGLMDGVGMLGAGSDGMHDFMARVVERFPVVHVQEFTGLKLVSGAATSPAAAPVSAASKAAPAAHGPQEAAVRREAPQPTAAASVAPALSAEEAYQPIRSQLNGEPGEAARAIERHLESYPEHGTAHNDLAAVSYQMGETEKAVVHYRLAVQFSPQEATFRKNLADLLYVELGEIEEPISIYLKLLEESPRDIETLLNLGIIAEGVGRPEEADTFYQRALELEPWNQDVRQRLSDLRSRPSETEPVEDDEPAEDRYQRAQELVTQGEPERAIGELEGILQADPDFPLAHNDLAVLYYERGDKEQALTHYQKAAALVPGNSTFQKNLADFYFVEGSNIDGAIEIYLDQLRKEPRNVDTLMNLGKICTVLDRPQEAESFYGKVTQLEPWNQAARECLNNVRRCVNG